ncbi:hypothetical protein [Methanosarcina barkeri]|nr:hypothetical protein [Methanosarcina barkeri]
MTTEGEVESGTGEEEIPFVPVEPNPFWKRTLKSLLGNLFQL